VLELTVTPQVSRSYVVRLGLQHNRLNPMQPSNAREADSLSACKEILYILWAMPFLRQLFSVTGETWFNYRHSDMPV
jgi:hypothetical protein